MENVGTDRLYCLTVMVPNEGLAELIRKMVKSGLTVCLIEHKMDMIMNLADKIMVLNYGEKIAEGTPAEIRANPAVIDAYLGSEHADV